VFGVEVVGWGSVSFVSVEASTGEVC
jgi:hypothetical protein